MVHTAHGHRGYWAVDLRGCLGSNPIAPKTAASLIRKGRARRIGPNVVLVYSVFRRVATETDVRRQWRELGPAACWETPEGPNWPYFSEVLARVAESVRPRGRRRTRIDQLCACRIAFLGAFEAKTSHRQRRRGWGGYSARVMWYQRWCLDVMASYGQGSETRRQLWRKTLIWHLRRTRQDEVVRRLALKWFDRLWAMANPQHSTRRIQRRRQERGAASGNNRVTVPRLRRPNRSQAQPEEKRVLVLLPLADTADPVPDADRPALAAALHAATEGAGGRVTTCVVTGSHVQLEALIPATMPTARYVQTLKAQSRTALPGYRGHLWGGHFYTLLPDPEAAAHQEAILGAELAAENARIAREHERRMRARRKKTQL